MNEVFKIDLAIKYLNKNYTLVFQNKNVVYYAYLIKENLIKIFSDNVAMELTLKNFEELFCNSLFTIYKDDEELVDPEKDKEFYTWKQ